MKFPWITVRVERFGGDKTLGLRMKVEEFHPDQGPMVEALMASAVELARLKFASADAPDSFKLVADDAAPVKLHELKGKPDPAEPKVTPLVPEEAIEAAKRLIEDRQLCIYPEDALTAISEHCRARYGRQPWSDAVLIATTGGETESGASR